MDPTLGSQSQYKLVRKRHSQLLLNKIQTFWKNDEFTDVSLVTKEGNIIKAHKLVLAACSEHFAKIFQNLPQQSQNQNPIIVICGGEHFDPIENIVKLMYAGETNISENRLLDIRQACSNIGMNDVVPLKTVPSTEFHNLKRNVTSEAHRETARAPAVPTLPQRKKGPRVKAMHEMYEQNKQNLAYQIPSRNEAQVGLADHVQGPLNLTVLKTKDPSIPIVSNGQDDQHSPISGSSLIKETPGKINSDEKTAKSMDESLRDSLTPRNLPQNNRAAVPSERSSSGEFIPRIIKQEKVDDEFVDQTHKIEETGKSISMTSPNSENELMMNPLKKAKSPGITSALENQNDTSMKATVPVLENNHSVKNEKQPDTVINFNKQASTSPVPGPGPSPGLSAGNSNVHAFASTSNSNCVSPNPSTESAFKNTTSTRTAPSTFVSGFETPCDGMPISINTGIFQNSGRLISPTSSTSSTGMTLNTGNFQNPGGLSSPPLSANKEVIDSRIKQSLAKLKCISFSTVSMNSSQAVPKDTVVGIKRPAKTKPKVQVSKKFAYDPGFFPNLNNLASKLHLNKGQSSLLKKKYKAPNPPGFLSGNKLPGSFPTSSSHADRVPTPKPKPRTKLEAMQGKGYTRTSTISTGNDEKPDGFDPSGPGFGVSQNQSQIMTSQPASIAVKSVHPSSSARPVCQSTATSNTNQNGEATSPHSVSPQTVQQSQSGVPTPRIRRVGQFQCSYCDKRFVHHASLKDHMNLHYRRLTCPVCQKAFTHEGNLLRHLSKDKCDSRKLK